MVPLRFTAGAGRCAVHDERGVHGGHDARERDAVDRTE